MRDDPIIGKKKGLKLMSKLIIYKKIGYKGGMKILGTGTPSIDLTLNMLFFSKLLSIIPHSLSIITSP